MWDTVGDDLANTIMSFFESGSLPKPINTTWVALIPRCRGPPIALSTDQLAWWDVSTWLSQKLWSHGLRKSSLPDLVGKTQSAFVAGKQILDGALIAN